MKKKIGLVIVVLLFSLVLAGALLFNSCVNAASRIVEPFVESYIQTVSRDVVQEIAESPDQIQVLPPPDLRGWEVYKKDVWTSQKSPDKNYSSLTLVLLRVIDRKELTRDFDAKIYIIERHDSEGNPQKTEVGLIVYPTDDSLDPIYYTFHPEEYTEILRADGTINFVNLYWSDWARWKRLGLLLKTCSSAEEGCFDFWEFDTVPEEDLIIYRFSYEADD